MPHGSVVTTDRPTVGRDGVTNQRSVGNLAATFIKRALGPIKTSIFGVFPCFSLFFIGFYTIFMITPGPPEKNWSPDKNLAPPARPRPNFYPGANFFSGGPGGPGVIIRLFKNR